MCGLGVVGGDGHQQPQAAQQSPAASNYGGILHLPPAVRGVAVGTSQESVTPFSSYKWWLMTIYIK